MEKNNDVCGVGVAYRARITGEFIFVVVYVYVYVCVVCVGAMHNLITVYIVRHCYSSTVYKYNDSASMYRI